MPRPRRHAPFADIFVHAGLLLALVAGFSLAAVLAAHLGFGLDVGPWWPVLIQVHGVAQVFGWLGLFIMGVSLYFLPRFAGAPLRSAGAARLAGGLVTAGIVLRGCGQILWFGDSRLGLTLLQVGSTVLALGVALYVALLLDCLIAADPARRPIRALRLCFLSTLWGWTTATAALTAQALSAAPGARLLDPGWHRFGLDLFVGFVLLPVAFAFSIRTFPLYLRLSAVRWSADRLVGLYLAGLALETAAAAAALRLDTVGPLADLMKPMGDAGRILKGGAILWFVWRLDLLTRRRPAWIVEREGEPPTQPQRHPRPRPHLPDYGEFGHFEWLLYGAYTFLVIGGALEVYGGLGSLLRSWRPIAPDLLRHLYLLGFGSLLLLGMAPRMLPGFWGVRRPASARLVDASFVLGVSAALLRLLPLAPGAWQVAAARTAFGLSGLLGWLAVACLAVNLWWTWGQARRKPPAASRTFSL